MKGHHPAHTNFCPQTAEARSQVKAERRAQRKQVVGEIVGVGVGNIRVEMNARVLGQAYEKVMPESPGKTESLNLSLDDPQVTSIDECRTLILFR